MSTILPQVSATPDQVEDAFKTFFHQPDFWSKILYAVLLLAACIVVSKVIMSVLNRALKHIDVEKSLHTFLKSSVRILLWFLSILIVLGYLGVEPGSLLAFLGILGLALSLAIQGTLTNLAGGLMVLASKPFQVGDYVEVAGVGGTVLDIGLVYTRFKTYDNKLIFVPNGEISKEKITNYTNQAQRRVDVTFSVSYDTPGEQVKNIMHTVIGRHSKTLFTPEPFVGMTKVNDSSVDYTVRVWCATEDYWDVYYDLLQQLWDEFRTAGVDLTYNHLNIHIMDQP